jgi:hypothetical protein
MKYGPISAASSAMMKAIANPSSVVCTVSPLGARAFRGRPTGRADDGAPQYIEGSAAKSQPNGLESACTARLPRVRQDIR